MITPYDKEPEPERDYDIERDIQVDLKNPLYEWPTPPTPDRSKPEHPLQDEHRSNK